MKRTEYRFIKADKTVLSGISAWAKGRILPVFAVLVIFSVLAASIPALAGTAIGAEEAASFQMDVSLNEYALNVKDSNYYAWRGKVNLSGEIPVGQVTGTKITAYLDSILTPVFTIDLVTMTQENEKYTFQTQLDTAAYQRGYHLFRIYDGTVTSFTGKEPIISVPIYIEYAEIATVVNVTSFCNMRTKPSSDSAVSPIVTTVALGQPVEVQAEVKGQTYYGTDLWYKVRYVNSSGSVFVGYIISYLLSKMKTGISKINVTAADTVFDDFLPGKTAYQVNLPYSSYELSVKDLVMYNKDDTLKVMLNGNEAVSPFTTLPLNTGDNIVEFICTRPTDSATIKYTYSIWRIAKSTEEEFKAQLAKFPESYKAALRALHSKYPNWLFTAYNTNLNWNDVIDNEDSGATSLIWKNNLPAEYMKSDVIMDGTSFVTASRAAVEYYVDPRNFFDEKSIFQFEQLTYQKTMHTLTGIQKLLSGSGLTGRESMFLNAAIESHVSPYHLAARSRQEVTRWDPIGLSTIATGKYTGANNRYYGLYNFYNIGTGSSTDSNLLTQRGLEFAMGNYSDGTPKPAELRLKYHMPWNTEEKAIIGGGIYIGENYINKGQDTLYLQKFDVDPTDGYYNHQYMQNVQAPYSEAQGSYKAYSLTSALNNSFAFKIPVYLGMPALQSPKPEDTNKLDSLSIDGYLITPAFDPGRDNIYELTVPSSVEKITVKATTLNSKAIITGTGEKTLNFGSANTFVVSCKPVVGARRDYTIKVTRNYPESSSDNLLSALSVSGSGNFTMTPAFSPAKNGPYAVTVPDTISEVTVSASPHVTSAIVSGTGTIALGYGSNSISVTVIAEDQTTRVYQMQITRSLPKVTCKTLVLANGTLNGVQLSTTFLTLKKDFNETLGTIKLYDVSGKECADTAIVGTGMKLKIQYGTMLLGEYSIIVYGDVNGDGKVNSTDITSLKSHVLKRKYLSGKYFTAGDTNKDGKVNSTDYTIMKRQILKLQAIQQK
ncbi:MAG: cadherin-like beta sandwich domain-containing protein [Saccharofermentanales bacterium]